jgi:hypothetical protein
VRGCTLLHATTHPPPQEPELLESLYAGSAAASAELGELQLKRSVAALAAACRPATPGATRPDEASVSKAVQQLTEVAGKWVQVGGRGTGGGGVMLSQACSAQSAVQASSCHVCRLCAIQACGVQAVVCRLWCAGCGVQAAVCKLH